MNITRSVDFSMYSSIKIGTKAKVTVVEDEDFDFTNYYIIGRANNLILTKNHPPLAMLSKKFSYIFIKENQLFIGGATPNGKIFSFCKKNNIKNFEFFRSLPGSLGGMIKMNAGMKDYEIFNHLIKIKISNTYINKNDISYGYRHTDIKGVIFEAVFNLEYGFCHNKVEIFAKMRKKQPQLPSAGSCFKNPKGNYAGALIEQVGLKGHRIGNMCFSGKHSNFLVNMGGGTSENATELIRLAQKKVKEIFNITLELEVVVV